MIENKSSLTKILERVSVWVVFGYLILENISRIIYSVNIFDVSIIDEDLENILFRKALSLIIILFILHSSWLLLTPISSYVYKPERFNKNKQQISNISDFYLFPVIVEFCLSFIVALFWVLILSSDNLDLYRHNLSYFIIVRFIVWCIFFVVIWKVNNTKLRICLSLSVYCIFYIVIFIYFCSNNYTLWPTICFSLHSFDTSIVGLFVVSLYQLLFIMTCACAYSLIGILASICHLYHDRNNLIQGRRCYDSKSRKSKRRICNKFKLKVKIFLHRIIFYKINYLKRLLLKIYSKSFTFQTIRIKLLIISALILILFLLLSRHGCAEKYFSYVNVLNSDVYVLDHFSDIDFTHAYEKLGLRAENAVDLYADVYQYFDSNSSIIQIPINELPTYNNDFKNYLFFLTLKHYVPNFDYILNKRLHRINAHSIELDIHVDINHIKNLKFNERKYYFIYIKREDGGYSLIDVYD